MFILTQDGGHILNTDHIADITLTDCGNGIKATTKTGDKVMLAFYEDGDNSLSEELADMLMQLQAGAPLYMFPNPVIKKLRKEKRS